MPCAAAGDLGRLADTGFVSQPYLHHIEADALVGRDACRRGGDVYGMARAIFIVLL
jgi:hypothetical protein